MSRLGLKTLGTSKVASLVANKTKRTRAPQTWTRPAGWLSMPDTSSGQKIAILMAVFDQPFNRFAVTISGAYTVDWGDGTSGNFNSGAKASKDYSYAAITTDTATQKATLVDGYKQVVITITPQAGQNLTSVNLGVRHSSDTRSTSQNAQDSQFLEIHMVGSSVSTLNMGTTISGSSPQVRPVYHPQLQNFQYTGTNSITSMNYGFGDCGALKKFSMDCSTFTSLNSFFIDCSSLVDVTITTSSALTNTSTMFQDCTSLVVAPLFDTSAATSMGGMFYNCFSLLKVPQYNYSAVTSAANMFYFCTSLTSFTGHFPASQSAGSMFYHCTSLKTVNLSMPNANSWSSTFQYCYSLESIAPMTSSAVTSFYSAFQGCSSLKRIPWEIDFSSATTVEFMFSTCTALEYIGGFKNMGNVTTINSMFQNCYSLTKLPSMSSLDSSATNAASAFQGCHSLTEHPNFGTAAFTAANSMFSGCYALKTVTYSFSAITSGMASTFANCYSLESVADITGAPTTLSNAFSVCQSLKTAPTFSNLSEVTTTSGMFTFCLSLTKTQDTWSLPKATTVSSMFSNCSALRTCPDINPLRASSTTGNPFVSSSSQATYSLQKVLKTQFPQSISFTYTPLSATALNTIYGNLPTLTARSITNVTGNGTTVTYTTSVAHNYQVGMTITMTGVTPTAYNLTSQIITSIPDSTSFTVTNAATGTYTSGGTVTPAVLTITVTGTVGTASDDPTIATAKGWAVTG